MHCRVFRGDRCSGVPDAPCSFNHTHTHTCDFQDAQKAAPAESRAPSSKSSSILRADLLQCRPFRSRLIRSRQHAYGQTTQAV